MTQPKQKTLPGIPANLAPRPSRARGAKRQKPEYWMQVNLMTFIKAHEKRFPLLSLVYCSLNGLPLSTEMSKQAKAQGMREGIWDLNLPVWSAAVWKDNMPSLSYPALWIEMKAGKNQLTTEQKRFKQMILDTADMARQPSPRFEVCRSWTAAGRVIIEHLGIVDKAIQEALRILPSEGKTK